MKKIRGRLTYANVMSSLAVFLVLGGATAFAASKIGANQLKANAVLTGKIAKEAVTASKIKKEAVTTPKIAKNAVTGEKVNLATLGTVPSASNALSLGGRSASEYAVRYFARVDGEGATPTLAAGSPGVTVSSTRPFTGAATVVFPVDMTNCAVTATAFSGGGTVLIARQSSISAARNVVIVIETPGGTGTNASFSVEGVC